MKKITGIFVSFFTVCIALHLKAQITVTNKSTPSAGENIIISHSNEQVDVKPTGANYTWDFSKVNPTSQDTYKFVSPQSVNMLYLASFPGDVGLDIKNPNISGMYAFFKSSSKDFRQEGVAATIPVLNIPAPVKYSSSDIIYRFPLTYGNSDDSCEFGVDTKVSGFSIKVMGKRHNIIDGWGQIKTPYKTYNCIRIKSIVTEYDTFAVFPINNCRTEYKWISTDEHIPVFEADLTQGQNGDTTMSLHFTDKYKNVIYYAGPQVDLSASDTVTFTKDTVQLFDKTTGSTLTSWLWTILPTTYSFVAGTSAASQNPKVIFNDTGHYWVSLKGKNSLGENTRLKINYITVSHNTSIKPDERPDRLTIYPNPASGNICIDLHGISSVQQGEVKIYNAAGAEVYSSALPTGNKLLNVSTVAFPAGLYFVKISAGEKTCEGKVTVQ